MVSNQIITLSRDCDAKLIPVGTKVTLLKGEKVQVTQSLGGSYTLNINGNLVQIDGRDADAIGFEPTADPFENEVAVDGVVEEEKVWNQLRTVYDPEIPINIVDLGLVYSCEITPNEEAGSNVLVKMTLTAPGCGMGPHIADDVKQKVSSIPGANQVDVELVWDPPWDREMMSDAAKLQLGMF